MVTCRGLRNSGFGLMSLFAVLLSSHPARSVEFKTGEQVTIAADQVLADDLYMTGDTLTVLGRVEGDVVASGRIVRIEGTVAGDLIAAGQVVVIQGEVLDDVRIAGMTLKLDEGARVGDDVIAAGFSFQSTPGSRVAGDTRVMGYQALIGGEHLQGLEANLIGLEISGTVVGDVEANVESEAGPAWWTQFVQSPVPLPMVDAGLKLTSEARIEGDLSYHATGLASIAEKAAISGEIRHEIKEVPPVPRPSVGQRLGRFIRWIVVLFLVGATLLWLVPDKMKGVGDTVKDRPLASLGWGLVALLGFPVAMILVLVLTLALTMAFGLMTLNKAVALVLVLGGVTGILLAAMLWTAMSYLAPAAAAFGGGRWLLTRGERAEKSRYLSLVVGLILIAMLGMVPIIGAPVRWLVSLIGLGAGALWSVRYRSRGQPS